MKTIHHVFDVNVPRARVHDAIASTAGLAGWWSTAVEGDARVGGQIHFTFVGDFNPVMEVVRLDPGTIEWRCAAGHEPWANGTFRFELADRDAGTRIRFWQEYARELDDDSFGIYSYNWAYYLESLRLLLENGAGKPFEVPARASS